MVIFNAIPFHPSSSISRSLSRYEYPTLHYGKVSSRAISYAKYLTLSAPLVTFTICPTAPEFTGRFCSNSLSVTTPRYGPVPSVIWPYPCGHFSIQLTHSCVTVMDEPGTNLSNPSPSFFSQVKENQCALNRSKAKRKCISLSDWGSCRVLSYTQHRPYNPSEPVQSTPSLLPPRDSSPS